MGMTASFFLHPARNQVSLTANSPYYAGIRKSVHTETPIEVFHASEINTDGLPREMQSLASLAATETVSRVDIEANAGVQC